jgi:uncharacterized DUF497 family protein
MLGFTKNAKEHRVTFEAARRAFDDPRAIDCLDLDEPDEDRMLLTGLANDVLLTVCFVETRPPDSHHLGLKGNPT